MRSVPFTVAAVGALLLLSACSGGSDGSSSASSSSASSDSSSASSGPDAGKDSAAKLSPLNEYTKSVPNTGDGIAKGHKEVQNIIASCMKEAGFEYTPEEPLSLPASFDEEEMDPVERAEKYGYGGAEQELDAEDLVKSPNADYVAAMSESEQTAYGLALFGEEQDPDEYDWTKGGCFAKASHEVYSNSNAAYEDPAYEDLLEEQRLMFEKVPDDPRLAQITAEWSACMNEAGFDFARVNEASDSISEARAALPESGDETAWADLRDQEMATAIADATCQEKVGYPEKLQEVQFALEQEFIDTHKAELDAWIEQYATDEAAK